MTSGTGFKFVAILALALAPGACSLQHWAIDKAGDALGGSAAAIAGDDDPELIRAAAPFSLKLTESLLAQDPRHPGLLLSAASGFVQYSYAFVQMDADMQEEDDPAAAARGRQRARRLYLRARDYGLRGLEVAHPGFREALHHDAPAAAGVLRRADVPLLYWTAVAWAGAVSQAKDDPDLVGDLPQVDALVASAARLDPDFAGGALQSFLIGYEMARDGRADVARVHFARAVELGAGGSVAPLVALAESVCVSARARGEFQQRLAEALAIDADRYPERRLENLVMQRRARWLQGRIDDLFLPEEKP